MTGSLASILWQRWRIFIVNVVLLSALALMGVGVFLLYLAFGYAMGMIRAIWEGDPLERRRKA